MTDKELMFKAIREAKKSEEPFKCGVVIAKQGRVIVSAHNNQRKSKNTFGHAETVAITKACMKLKSNYLENCSIYCTCEPCSMCLAAIIISKISKLFFGISLKEGNPNHLPITLPYKELLKHTKYNIEVVPNFMQDECLTLKRREY